MLIISHKQIEKFRQVALTNFETRMVAHCQDFSPRLSAVIGEGQLRIAVKAAINRARGHGLTLQGPVRLFIEMTLLFGSAFDTDPQYPWAVTILAGIVPNQQIRRAEALYDRTRDYLRDVAGPDNAYTRTALEQLALLARQPAPISASNLYREIDRAYPQKVADLGKAALDALIRDGLEAARAASLSSPRGMVLMVLLRIAFGHGCAGDPLYPWIERTLRDDRIVNPSAREARLERKARTWLRHVIADASGEARS